MCLAWLGCNAETVSDAPEARAKKSSERSEKTSVKASNEAERLSGTTREQPLEARASRKPGRASDARLSTKDPEVVKAVEDILKACVIEDETGWVRGCPSKKQMAEVETLRTLIEQKGMLDTLPTMAVLLTEGEDRQRHFITAELDTTFARKFPPPHFLREIRKDGKTVDRETARQLIQGLYGLNETAAGHLIGTATHAAAMAGEVDSLMRAVREMPYLELRHAAHRNLLVVKRLAHFARIEAFAKSGQLRALLTALQAVSAVDEPTPEEQGRICPWAATYLHHRDAKVAGEVARLLMRCAGEFPGKVIAELSARLKAQDFSLSKELLAAVGTSCGPMRANPKGAICQRAGDILKKVITDESTKWSVRAYAVETLGKNWPTKETLSFLRRHEDSKIPHVKWATKGAIFDLSSTANVRDGASVDTRNPGLLPSWKLNAQSYGLGETIKLLCPPDGDIGLVVGSGPYSASSSVCSAAAHAGKIERAEGGEIRFRVVRRVRTYTASQSFGIQSRASGPESETSIVFP